MEHASTLVSEATLVGAHTHLLCRWFTNIELAYGGFGFTSRMWGLTLDTISSVNIVLANGTIVEADSQRNPDLFWVRSYSSARTKKLTFKLN